MLSEEFPTSNIRCQHLYRLMAAHLLHFENTCAASLGLGQKTRSQTMSGKLSGIVTSSRRILFYQACYAPVRHRSFRRTVCRGQLAKQWSGLMPRRCHPVKQECFGPNPPALWNCDHNAGALLVGLRPTDRSEEHTSELQSLMRISYAVFCLKKKT